MKITLTTLSIVATILCSTAARGEIAMFAETSPVIDGNPQDIAWEQAEWRQMDQLMLGNMPTADDFSGQYKIVWTHDSLYILAEIVDDLLIDSHADPLQSYWDDDSLEIMIDEDASGGLHQFNYSAFAYHISLDNQPVDIGPFLSAEDRAEGRINFRTYPEHLQSVWQRSTELPHKINWEVRITVFGNDYKDSYGTGEQPARPVKLHAGKKLGLMVTYNDADSANGREHFMGDTEIAPVNGDRNLGYIDASVFGNLTLKK